MVIMMVAIADLNFLLALNTRIRCKLSPNSLVSSSSSSLITHGCANACAAVILSTGSTVNILPAANKTIKCHKRWKASIKQCTAVRVSARTVLLLLSYSIIVTNEVLPPPTAASWRAQQGRASRTIYLLKVMGMGNCRAVGDKVRLDRVVRVVAAVAVQAKNRSVRPVHVRFTCSGDLPMECSTLAHLTSPHRNPTRTLQKRNGITYRKKKTSLL